MRKYSPLIAMAALAASAPVGSGRAKEPVHTFTNDGSYNISAWKPRRASRSGSILRSRPQRGWRKAQSIAAHREIQRRKRRNASR